MYHINSLYRDGADITRPLTKMKRLRTPKRYSYKLSFSSWNKLPQKLRLVFVAVLHLKFCDIVVEKNRLSLSNFLQSWNYIYTWPMPFLTVASRDPCTAERAYGFVRHMRIKHHTIKKLWNKNKNIFIELLKDIWMVVPKIMKTSFNMNALNRRTLNTIYMYM